MPQADRAPQETARSEGSKRSSEPAKRFDTAGRTGGGAAPAGETPQELVLVTGISGSGKSVALNALEDAGFYCVDNLPPELLREFIRLEAQREERSQRRLAIAVDVRSRGSLPHLLPLIGQLSIEGVAVRALFLDASTESLMRRFSETRRRHPLSTAPLPEELDEAASARALIDAIELERELLADLRAASTVIDTSTLRPTQLRIWVRQLVAATAGSLTLVFQSFAYRHGVPLDADLVFDVRVLPNPHYVRELRPLSGRDAPVAQYLAAQPEVMEMLDQIEAFIARWLPAFEQDQRAYLTVAIGCTGGQHRSVWFAEQLALRLRGQVPALVRHREWDAR